MKALIYQREATTMALTSQIVSCERCRPLIMWQIKGTSLILWHRARGTRRGLEQQSSTIDTGPVMKAMNNSLCAWVCACMCVTVHESVFVCACLCVTVNDLGYERVCVFLSFSSLLWQLKWNEIQSAASLRGGSISGGWSRRRLKCRTDSNP